MEMECKLKQQKVSGEPCWAFSGRVPTPLAYKYWQEKADAIKAAEREGFAVNAEGWLQPTQSPQPENRE